MQTTVQRIVDRIDRHCPQTPGDQRTVIAQARGFDPGAAHDQAAYDQRVGEKKSFRIGRRSEQQLPDQRCSGIDTNHHRQARQRMQPDQPTSRAISLRLMSRKVHVRPTLFESAATEPPDRPEKLRTTA